MIQLAKAQVQAEVQAEDDECVLISTATIRPRDLTLLTRLTLWTLLALLARHWATGMSTAYARCRALPEQSPTLHPYLPL